MLSKTPDEDFVPAIADALSSSPLSRSQVEKAVRYQIGILQEWLQERSPPFGERAKNKEYAKEVADLARQLQQKLEGAPEGTGRSLFLFARYGQKAPRPDDVNYAEVELYRAAFLLSLKEMQTGCAIISANPIGDYHTVDVLKKLCAEAAGCLMIGLDAGQPTNSNEKSALRIIANTLYEAVAPDQAKEWAEHHKGNKPDLRSQCEETIKQLRARPEAERQQIRKAFQLLSQLHE
jgi:hypothetical protein